MGLELTTDRYQPITSQTRYPLRHATSQTYVGGLVRMSQNSVNSAFTPCVWFIALSIHMSFKCLVIKYYHNVWFLFKKLITCSLLLYILMYFISSFDFCRFCVVIRFFIPATTANDLRLRRIFYPRFNPLHLFILILEKVPLFTILNIQC